ncbi:MAG: PaaI family thioesterase [Pseudomonadales bacterium]
MTIISGHEEIVSAWRKKSPADLNLPPSCWLHMGGEFIQWNTAEKSLLARFPFKVEFENPRHFMQGGFVIAALDNVLGPLSYLVDAPSVTVQLNTSFIRPVTADLDYIEVEAKIIDQTSRNIYSVAEARSPAGKILSSVQVTSHIVK